MFQFRWYPTYTYLLPFRENISYTFLRKTKRVSPFGNRRITGFWLLPDEYRCHMRPSSAEIPRASIVSFVALWRTKESFFTNHSFCSVRYLFKKQHIIYALPSENCCVRLSEWITPYSATTHFITLSGDSHFRIDVIIRLLKSNAHSS